MKILKLVKKTFFKQKILKFVKKLQKYLFLNRKMLILAVNFVKKLEFFLLKKNQGRIGDYGAKGERGDPGPRGLPGTAG